jgi:hypothetical protein
MTPWGEGHYSAYSLTSSIFPHLLLLKTTLQSLSPMKKGIQVSEWLITLLQRPRTHQSIVCLFLLLIYCQLVSVRPRRLEGKILPSLHYIFVQTQH